MVLYGVLESRNHTIYSRTDFKNRLVSAETEVHP